MSKARTTTTAKLTVVASLVLFMIAQHPGVLSSAEAVKATTAVKHKPLKHFVSGHRVSVEAKVTDPQGVRLVRCYFRAAGQADYVFVGMKAGDSDTFTGILPAPGAETKNIEYLFLAVNGKNQVVKTQAFRTELKAVADIPDWQKSGGEGQVAVSSELVQAAAPRGFTDSITLNVVESSLRFGYVAGIYSTTQVAVGGGSAGAAAGGGSAAAGGATGTAATAVSAGTVTASTGVSTVVIVGAGAAAVAVGAGVAVAGGGDGSDAGSAAGSGSDTAKSGCDRYAGSWAAQVTVSNCTLPPGGTSLTLPMTIRSDCSATICEERCHDGQVVGNIVSFSFPEIDCGGTTTITGTFASDSSLSGTISGSTTGTLSATKQ